MWQMHTVIQKGCQSQFPGAGDLNRCRGLEVTGEDANHNSKVAYSWWAPDPRLASNSLCS